MVLTVRTPRLTCDNGLFAFTNVEKDEFTLDEMTKLMVEKLKLIYDMHFCVGKCGPSTEEAMQKLCCTERQTRIPRVGGRKKHGEDEKAKKEKTLLTNWEGSYAFVKYKDKKGYREFDDDYRVCVLQGIDGKQWECVRHDLQMFN
jgi:hypothetical protein